jgi:hypothetical protein
MVYQLSLFYPVLNSCALFHINDFIFSLFVGAPNFT